MKKRKIFLGIELDSFLKKSLDRNLKKYKDLPIRWHDKNSYHIPLLYLGWLTEDDIMALIDHLEQISGNFNQGEVSFTKVKLIENSKNGAKRVKLVGESSEYLKELYTGLMDELGIKHPNIKSFSPAVSLGQIRAHAWDKLNDKPSIDIDFNLIYDILSITLYEESRDGSDGNYKVLANFELK